MATSVAFIGLRGSGKTVVGREVARLLGGSFLDTDDLVVQAAGRTISDIFAGGGEAEFRRLERQAVARAVAERPAVLGVGGGAVIDPTNAAAIRSLATVVWLTAPPEVLLLRIDSDPTTAASRPRLTQAKGLQEIQELLAARAPIYQAMADLAVDTNSRSPNEVAREVIKLVDNLP